MRSSAQQRKRELPDVTTQDEPALPVLGRIAAIDESGQVFVMALRRPRQRVLARLSSTLDPAELREAAVDRRSVLLLYEGDAPVIIGLVRDRLPPPAPPATQGSHERLILEAQEEVVLRCGPGNITLRKDGKVIIKGVDLVSRARQTNRIRGASVKIN